MSFCVETDQDVECCSVMNIWFCIPCIWIEVTLGSYFRKHMMTTGPFFLPGIIASGPFHGRDVACIPLPMACRVGGLKWTNVHNVDRLTKVALTRIDM